MDEAENTEIPGTPEPAETPEKDLSLLVVDMWWEEEVKDRERGYRIVSPRFREKYGRVEHDPYPKTLQYPHGTLRAGVDTIHDVVRMAYLLQKNVYGVAMDNGYTPAKEMLDKSLHPYIPDERIFLKGGYDAFESKSLVRCLEKDGVSRLMIVGFDRDICVLETIKGAVNRQIEVITGEVLMLTSNLRNREIALRYFKENTTYLESLVDVWNFLDPTASLEFHP